MLGVRRLLVVGWDGAEPSLVESLCSQGRLPHLKALKARGAWGRLGSTFPASSLPAWTTALTGLGPGRHGLVDYVQKDPRAFRLGFMSADQRLAVTLPVIAGLSGLRTASLGVPGTYPPEPSYPGVCIAGFDSPFALRASRNAFYPPELHDRLQARGLSWPYGAMDEMAVGPGWHQRAQSVLLDTIEKKLQVAEAVLEEQAPFDLFMLVFSESDTAAHHFWAFHDTCSPRYRREPELADSLEEVYCCLDRALGRLLRHLDDSAAVLVLSDHGAGGASDRVFYPNRWLASQGWLRFNRTAGLVGRVADLVRDAAGRYLPARVKQALLRSRLAGVVMQADALGRFGGLDLQQTRAYSDELPQNPGIWIHLGGRDPEGTVRPGDEYERLRDQIIEKLQGYRDPETGRPVVSRVLRREEALPGPGAKRAPDLLVEPACWDGYRILAAQSNGRSAPILRRLHPTEMIGSKGTGVSGVHRPEGMLVAAGPMVKPKGSIPTARIEDIFPTMAGLLGIEACLDLDGRPIREITGRASSPAKLDRPGCDPKPDSTFTPEEEAVIRRRLQGLGYL